jgi:hypothetical protein
MKKIVLLLTAAIVLHLIPANATAEFYLKVSRTGKYSVQFADQNQSTPSGQFRFHDLMAGICSIKVIDTYTNRVIYNGSVTLNDGYRTVAELDNFGTLRVLQNIQVRQVAWYMDEYPNYYAYGNGTYNNGSYNNGYNNGYGYNTYDPNCGTGNNGSWNNQNTYYWNNGSGSNGSNNNWNSWGQGNVTDDNTFRNLKDYVSRQSFDSSKLSAAKEVTQNNRLKSSQVADLCKLFSFDDNRLEYAKYAYNYVSDKGNYYLVSNTFSFSSNADALRSYTSGQ